MQQEKALALLKSGKNVFLTGSAGTGKTYVLNKYISYLKERKVPVAITASTGIAATHMNGMTIHSWAGFGIKERLTRANLVTMRTKKYLKKHLEESMILIIDEISMLHKNQLDMVDEVLRFFKEDNRAFGGIQIVLCGDFFQLPPIGNYDEKSKDKFSFMSQAWLSADLKICYLTEQYRQEEDNVLNGILGEIRSANISPRSIELLKKAGTNVLDKKETPTKLFTHNADVDQLNNIELDKLTGRARKFKASTKGNKKLVETLKKSVLAHELLELKIDAKVMFVRNNPEQGYVNGTLGTVIDFTDEGFPIVMTFDKKRITVKQETWGIHDDFGKVLASLDQIPLRLAWAITVHKCQGMTLDSALIDLSKTFERGQGYVALSRLRDIENLQLSGFNEMALKVDGLALKADLRFQELSQIVDDENDFESLEVETKDFIKACGGLTNIEEIKKHAKKLNGKKVKKQSTYEVTLGYLKQKMLLEKIAEERGLSQGTIAGHLIRLRKDFPNEDLDFYKPDAVLLEKVAKAKKKLKEDSTSLKPLHTALNGKVDYEDIKLALAFL
ncbi:AAA family ATPase [Maribacter sp. TH_r10]|uniref:AAA family ATPase n=1 Tax=Maribacter sp. TH_r10 TaxID=3082086 RepID=UPI0029550242|nr:helix-turn-helix domain-containing protein [Maribacter sp. TH_r10]MDV7138021.1 AAA family ATPase [Maribacter sp. TH_r10]